jgi:hypothetical protein
MMMEFRRIPGTSEIRIKGTEVRWERNNTATMTPLPSTVPSGNAEIMSHRNPRWTRSSAN